MDKKTDELNDKKVLITGGLGLIGSTIANKLVKLGCAVTILDAELPRYGGNRFNIESVKDSVELVIGDIRNRNTTDYIVKSKDIIFNLAGQVDYNYSLENPFLDMEINCKGHLNVLESCKTYNSDVKIVFSGSRMQYGRITNNPVTEDHPTNPLSIYGVHKLTGEKYYLAYYRHNNIKCTCFRIANPYGPRSQMKHSNYSILNWFVRQAMDGNEIYVFGEGTQARDYVYVEDIADALIAAAFNNETNGKVYNVGSGIPTRFIDMVQMVIDTVGKGKITKKEWPENWENVETGDFYADISELRRDTGWKPKFSLKEGIEKTVEYYSKHKNHYW